jgi:preprotein translocase subunit SecE
MADKIKLLVAILLVIAGVAGFYVLKASPNEVLQSTVLRVVSVLLGVVLGGVVAGSSALGKQFFGFALASRDEAKKVVWPTRKETIQMTGVVVAFVVVMALFLWTVDSILTWLVKLAMGQGG